MAQLTAIALSGGIDSSVAALRLKAAGERIFAIHFVTGFEGQPPSPDHLADMQRLADRLGIGLEVFDCREAFQRQIVAYFVEAYRLGRTPNPCVRCNSRIKFGLVLSHARALGARRLASGHYARLARDVAGRLHLYKGLDTQKDQSYFLSRLTQDQLKRAVFPLGSMTKAQVRRQAAEAGLMVRHRRESQDVCFIPQGEDYADFLTGPGGLEARPGPIVDTGGRSIGRHGGLHAFTVGQRRGINCPGPTPYYVVRLEPAHNRLVVGSKLDLMADGCRVSALHWIQPPPPGPLKVAVRLRFRSPERPAEVTVEAGSKATVLFTAAQSAVTPGQCAVFYRGQEVLGGGWIEAPIAPVKPSGQP